MRKNIALLLAFVLTLSCAFFSVSAETKNFEVVSTEKTEELLSTYMQVLYAAYVRECEDRGVEAISLEEYTEKNSVGYFGVLGEFGDAYLLIAADGGWLAPAWNPLGKYTFNGYFNGYDAFCVYKDGAFIRLGEAYASGLVTDAMLDESIGKNRNKLNDWTSGIARLLGDIDDDGQLSVSDVVLLRQKIVDGDAYCLYDIDSDGAVSVSDVIALRERIVA